MPDRRLPSICRTLLIAAAFSQPLCALDFVVTRYNDPFPDGCAPGDCSLREATIAANDSPGADRVLLSAGTYSLTRFGPDDVGALGDLDLLDEVEIVGPAATMTRIDAAPLGSASTDPVLTVFLNATLRGLTILGGANGGVRIAGGDLTMEECEVMNNDFQGNSAGILATGGGTIVIRDSAIINNGSGLDAVGGSVTMENVTLNSNGQNQIIIQNSSDLLCTHCTVVDGVGGNPEIRVGATSSATFANSIVSGVCNPFSGGTITSFAGNVESPGHSCGFTLAGDRDDIADPGLTALGDHGGGTRTFDLVAGNPGSGLVEPAECLVHDQRGVARSFHFQVPCDSGAVERVTNRVSTPIFEDGFEQGDGEAWSTVVAN